MRSGYIQLPVEKAELDTLLQLAQEEESQFFKRNPHLVEFYRSNLVAIALCQGAALQYIGKGYGIKDFDLHFFYRQNPNKKRLSRAVKRICTDLGKFEGAPIDFVRTVISFYLTEKFDKPVELIRAFLEEKPTKNAHHIANKAVVGLYPESIYSKIIWPTTPN